MNINNIITLKIILLTIIRKNEINNIINAILIFKFKLLWSIFKIIETSSQEITSKEFG